jgi:hypothetical protein
MARSRSIKPGFFQNEVLGECDHSVRLLFAGLWTLADREGRLEDRPARIRVALFPYEPALDVNAALQSLHDHSFIQRYVVDGRSFIQILTWHKHQNPHHMEAPSEIPPMPGTENRFNQTPVTKEQRQRIFRRDGFKCVQCNENSRLTIDHIVPVSSGGTSLDSNLQTLCSKCNEKKGKRPQVEDESRTNRGRIEQLAHTPTLTLNPEPLTLNRIPDSGSLIPDSLQPTPSSDNPPLEISEEEKRKNRIAWMRDNLIGYVGGPDTWQVKEWGIPDEEICTRCLEAAGAASLPLLGSTLKELRKTKGQPSQSWGWFPERLAQMFQPNKPRRSKVASITVGTA